MLMTVWGRGRRGKGRDGGIEGEDRGRGVEGGGVEGEEWKGRGGESSKEQSS